MPMRNERSTARLYMPCWFSPMTVPNQQMNRMASSKNPGISDHAGSQSFSSRDRARHDGEQRNGGENRPGAAVGNVVLIRFRSVRLRHVDLSESL